MKFGVKAPDESEDMQGGGGEKFIRYFNKDGMFTMRFLQPWSEWTSYWEHYSTAFKCSYPCTANKPEERKDCPGCQLGEDPDADEQTKREAKASKKYLVNALRTDDEKYAGYVDLWKIPGSLKEDLLLNNAKDKSLSKREYNVIRREKNGRTSYSLDKEDPMPIDLDQYKDQLLDHDEALTKAWEYRWDDKKREVEQARREKSKKDREDNADEPQARTASVRTAVSEDPPSKRAGLSIVPDPEPEPEEQVHVTASSIRKMTTEQLRKLYVQGGFEVPDSDDQAVLAEKLIAALS